MIDSDTINKTALEERAYRQWERKEKNRILSIKDERKKQEQWERAFGIVKKPDDSYLLGNIF